ncbi:rap guanine nucleotide exchange factor 1 isoform X1 [Rhinichthys klamathensis goyatoka]|uniref:rap guanine nucleotide exchange factor 1 isoform X1 n=1 Tax=Rhinichthys klamathensis goyatoka TaxID=3034132 RepID=UPI0024B5550E|nr:rap guanine nucleotide exchange factor 1 isoform X1 [Rhinichthys klamathensis goyatoka]
MSGKIDSKQESQRSHLTSFTMKLKDKFHSPKIKRTPSNKKSKPPPEQPVKSPEKTVTKSLSRLEEHEKEVVSALRYFKTIIDKMVVDKKVLEMLPGSASKVLEAIMSLVQLDGKTLSSSRVSSCLNRLYQSLANLIRWSDQVMLEGVNLEDKEIVATVTTVIKAVLDGVKELVKVAIEKQEHPSPTTPVKTLPPVTSPKRVPELPITESKETVLNETPTPAEATETPNDVPDEEMAPPKPPLPGLKVPEHCPPALPPKKRQSAPSPTRIAVVAPMSRTTSGSSLPIGIFRQEYEADALQRRFSGGSHSYGGESPRLSPCGSIGILSRSDEQLSSLEQDSGQCSRNTSCETLDTAESYDPDYDFLHQDLSSIDQIPPAHTGGCLSPLPESHHESSSSPVQFQSIPPALPKKERRPPLPQVERLYSQYDNVPDEDMQTPPFPLFASMPPSNPGEFMGNFGPAENTQIPQSPPPLPEKKSRHILKYMQFMEDYSEPLPSVFYQTPQSESIYEQRNRKRFQEVYGLSDSFSSSDETLPPPALPPKQRQLASSHSASPSSSSSSSLSCQLQQCASGPGPGETETALSLSASNSSLNRQGSLPVTTSESANDEGGEGEYVNLYSSNQANGDVTLSNGDSSCGAEDSLQDSESENSKDPTDREGWKQKCVDSELTSEEVDELSLIDHDEIMSRLTLKQENDDGPDVRAGSGDILLVHATETDRKDRVLYCEAFLTTYRTFLTPEDLIKKLRYRFTRFSLSSDIIKQRSSKNTFFVLVRVVDELCLVELTEDILKQLMELVFSLLCKGELTLARVLRKNILDKVQQKKLLQYTNSLKTLAARGVAARPGTLHDFRSHEIADQLTLLDAELFYKIEIPEVLLWAKEQNEEKSPNLTQFTEHFNNMSYWVRSLIILQEKAQDREKLLLKFIKIMKHLRKLNNFNSYLAILSALDSAPIRRLEWQKQTSEGLEEYCTLIDSSSSFRAYRAALADVEPPCIPYLGLILQDLTFVHLGNPDLIKGKINFSKRWQQFNILDTMRRFQQVHYDLKHNDDIVSFFNDFSDHLAEEALWELSLKIKPRNITRRKTEREEKT